MFFDGINDSIKVFDNDSLDMGNALSLNILLKISPEWLSADAWVVSRYLTAAGGTNYGITFHNWNKVYSYINSWGNSLSYSLMKDLDKKLLVSQVYDGNFMYIYI